MARLVWEQMMAMNKNAVKNFGDLAKMVEEGEKAVKAVENSAKGKRVV